MRISDWSSDVCSSDLKLQQLELVDEARREDALHAVEGLAAQPDEFVFLETKRADVVELLSKLLDGDDIGEPHIFGAIIETKGNLDLRVFLEDQLTHEKLVKIVVEQATYDRIHTPIMCVLTAGEIHGFSPL